MTHAPIAVVTHRDDPNRFHRYVEEILLAEGYPWYRTYDLAGGPLDPAALRAAAVVVVCAVTLTAEQEDEILALTAAGARVLLLRPGHRLARAFGLEPFEALEPLSSSGWPRAGGPLILRGMTDRYVRANPDNALAASMAAGDLQFHERADLYTWQGDPAAVALWLAPFLGQPSPHPAVVCIPHGAGRAVVYTFDLAASTVRFHQGRPEQASTGAYPDYDADGMYKANDLFVGCLDERLLDLPQADLHQDLFVRALQWLAPHPLPRVWHYPGDAPAVALFDGDSDGMSRQQYEDTMAVAGRHGVPYTVYVKSDDYGALSPARHEQIRAAGHGAGQHNWSGPRPELEEMRLGLRDQLASFERRYGCRAVSIRGHSTIWVGWTEMAQYLAAEGIRLDVNFAPIRYFDRGYLNGSGLPARFMDSDGRFIDLYEQVTISTDDGWRTDKTFLPARSLDECIADSRRQADDARDRYHTVYHPYFHPISLDVRGLMPWFDAMLAYTADIPRFSDAGWVAFNDARRALRLEALDWDPRARSLTFAVRAGAAVDDATLVFEGAAASASVDGEPVPVTCREREGRQQSALVAELPRGAVRRFSVRWS